MDIFGACGSGTADQVREFIREGVNVNRKNDQGDTPLYIAARAGKADTVKLLLDHGANIHEKNYDGDTPICYAAGNCETDLVKLLLDHGANIHEKFVDGGSPLHHAAFAGRGGRSDTFKLLLDRGADLFSFNNEGKTALHILVDSGNIHDNAWKTLMHILADKGHYEVIPNLITAGADPNIQDIQGETVLHGAADGGHIEVTETLITAGANPNIQDIQGETVLHRAADRGHIGVVKTLINAGADLNIQDNQGKTGLERAARSGKYDVVSTLIDEGAKVPASLASLMMHREPGRISSALDFLSKKLDKCFYKREEADYKETIKILGIEKFQGGQNVMFYNVECKELDDKSLLKYIESQNVRLSRQKEELIDLSVKIANLNHRFDTKRAMEEVINHYKSGLHSGVGLRDMIAQIKERYPWSSMKKKIMIFNSLVTCLVLIGLYVFDLTTDFTFSLDMFNPNIEKNSVQYSSCPILKNKSIFPSCTENCWAELVDNTDNIKLEFITKVDYEVTGWISLYHCIQPFVATMIVFFSMSIYYNKGCTTIPIPALTYIYRFYLDVRCHLARSHTDFRTKIGSIEGEIREHEILGEL